MDQGIDARDKFTRAGRKDIEVQVFKKSVPAPTKRDAGIDAIKFALYTTGMSYLKAQCAPCRRDVEGEHSCAWPSDSGSINTILGHVQVDPSVFESAMTRVTGILRGRYTPAQEIAFVEMEHVARDDLAGGRGVSQELLPLFSHLESYQLESINMMDFN